MIRVNLCWLEIGGIAPPSRLSSSGSLQVDGRERPRHRIARRVRAWKAEGESPEQTPGLHFAPLPASYHRASRGEDRGVVSQTGAGDGSSKRAGWLLGLGAAAGLLMATAGIVGPAPDADGPPPEGVAALVNGVEITQESYMRALGALSQDSRNPLGEPERRHVLDRLIEEELLVQRAVDLGLDVSDRTVRNRLVSAMIEMIVSGVDQREFSRQEVEAFYRENRDFFARSDRLWVRQLRFAVDRERGEAEAFERAERAADRLRRGEKIEDLAAELGDSPLLPVPDGLLPASKLREYLGPTPTRKALELATGEVSDPVRGGSAYHVLQMVQRVTAPSLPLSAVEPQVRSEMRRRAGDESLRSYLDTLRERAEIRLPPAPSGG
jgi:parvulin-like peptidyl-prolyl isomerase